MAGGKGETRGTIRLTVQENKVIGELIHCVHGAEVEREGGGGPDEECESWIPYIRLDFILNWFHICSVFLSEYRQNPYDFFAIVNSLMLKNYRFCVFSYTLYPYCTFWSHQVVLLINILVILCRYWGAPILSSLNCWYPQCTLIIFRCLLARTRLFDERCILELWLSRKNTALICREWKENLWILFSFYFIEKCLFEFHPSFLFWTLFLLDILFDS